MKILTFIPIYLAASTVYGQVAFDANNTTGSNAGSANSITGTIDVASPSSVDFGGSTEYTFSGAGSFSETSGYSGTIGVTISSFTNFNTSNFTGDVAGVSSNLVSGSSAGYGAQPSSGNVNGPRIATTATTTEALVFTFDLSGLTLAAGQQLVLTGVIDLDDTGDQNAVASLSNGDLFAQDSAQTIAITSLSELTDGTQIALYNSAIASADGFRVSGLSLDIVAVAIPEPSTYALVAGIFAVGILGVRRRFKK